MTLRLSSEQEQRLNELATVLGRSKTQVLGAALDEKYERDLHQSRVDQAATFFRGRDANLLRRLAEM